MTDLFEQEAVRETRPLSPLANDASTCEVTVTGTRYIAPLPPEAPCGSATGSNHAGEWLANHRLDRPGREPKHPTYGECTLRSEISRFDPLSPDRRRDLFISALRVGSLVGAGELTEVRAFAALVEAGMQKLSLPRPEAEKQARRGLRKGVRSPRTASPWGGVRSREDARLHWVRWYDHLDAASDVFAGRTGRSLLKLFAGFMRVGVGVGRVDLALAVRQAAEASGMSKSTAERLMQPGGPVERSGYLRAIKRAKPGSFDRKTSTVWRPTFKRYETEDLGQDGCVALGGKPSVPEVLFVTADVFEGRALAWRLHDLLDPQEVTTVAELVVLLGATSKESVRENLKWLAQRGLAKRVAHLSWTGTTLAPTSVRSFVTADGETVEVREVAKLRHERHIADRNDMKKQAAKKAQVLVLRAAVEAERLASAPQRADEIGFNPDEPCPTFDPETGEIITFEGVTPWT